VIRVQGFGFRDSGVGFRFWGRLGARMRRGELQPHCSGALQGGRGFRVGVQRVLLRRGLEAKYLEANSLRPKQKMKYLEGSGVAEGVDDGEDQRAWAALEALARRVPHHLRFRV